MRETDKSIEQIVEDILSGDPRKIWSASCEICSCRLLGEQSNPKHLVEDGYLEMVEVVNCTDGNYIDYYRVRCKKCNTIYKVYERQYHMPWWEWQEDNRH